MRLQVQHSSLEVFDTPAQKRHDATKVFTLGSHIITGTEAGPGKGNVSHAALADVAERTGYTFWGPAPQDCWVAIRRDFIAPGTKPERGLIPVLKGAEALDDPHRYGPKGLPWVTVETAVGTVTVGAGHWLTKGRRRHQAQDDRPGDPVDHFAANSKMGKAVAEWATDKAAGRALIFYGADTNLNDRTSDVFRGEPLTTCWDEIGKWPNTGHGPIDVIATYDHDGRVRCRSARTLTDRIFYLNADHHTVVATYEVATYEVPR
jgi:hypothetical protein